MPKPPADCLPGGFFRSKFAAGPAGVKRLREALPLPEFREVTAVDFSVTARSRKTYGEFLRKMARTSPATPQYLGLALRGPKKQASRFTGNPPLSR